MSNFVKKTWATDELIEATDLNRMESGIEEAMSSGGGGGGGGSLPFDLVNVKWDDENDEYHADATNAAIRASIDAGRTVLAVVYEKNGHYYIAPMNRVDMSDGSGTVIHYVVATGVYGNIDEERGRTTVMQATLAIDEEDYGEITTTTLATGTM